MGTTDISTAAETVAEIGQIFVSTGHGYRFLMGGTRANVETLNKGAGLDGGHRTYVWHPLPQNTEH